MVCNREHHDLVSYGAVDEGVREAPELKPSSVGDPFGPGGGKLQSDAGGLFDGLDETARDLSAGLAPIVASLSVHLGVRSRVEADDLHSVNFLARANTSSAGMSSTSPRS